MLRTKHAVVTFSEMLKIVGIKCREIAVERTSRESREIFIATFSSHDFFFL